MKKTLVIICSMVLIVLFFANNSFAIEFGGYIDLGSGSGKEEYGLEGAEEVDFDTSFYGVGFQLETNPLSGKKVYSYRLQAGFESRDIEDEDSVNLELQGFVINNTFAFGGNPSETIRLWAGPQVMFGYYRGETDKDYLVGDTISFSGYGFGLGAACGANFGLGSGKAILTTTIGVRALELAGDTEWLDEEVEMSGSSTEVFFSVGILF